MNVDILTKANNEEAVCLQIHGSHSDSHGLMFCYQCNKFNEAQEAARSLAERGMELTIIENDQPIGTSRGYYQAWCGECSDGLNDEIFECTSWVVNHKLKRH